MFIFIKNKYIGLIEDEKFKEIFTGSIWTLIARLTSTLLAMAISIIVARLYGPESLGILTLVQSLMLFATIFTLLGTNTSILRLIPEHISKYSLTSAYYLHRKTHYIVAFSALVTGVLFFISSGFLADIVFSKPVMAEFFALTSIFIIFKSLMELNTQAIRGLRLIRVYALMQILPYLATLLCLLSITWFSHSRGNPVYAQFAGWALTAMISVWIINRTFTKGIKKSAYVQKVTLKGILSLSLPMLMTASMQFFIGQTGVIILGIFQSESEVGFYSVAVKLATLTTFVLQAINSMAAPKFSELFHAGKINELLYVAKKSSKLIFWSTAPILLILFAFGKIILNLLYGLEFQVAYLSLTLLVAGQFVNAVSGSTAIFMNMTGNETKLRNIVFAAAFINILLNLLFVPDFGINGAAVASMVSMSFWNIYILMFIRMKFGVSIGYFPPLINFYKH